MTTIDAALELRSVQRALVAFEERSLGSALRSFGVTWLYYTVGFSAAVLLPLWPLRVVAAFITAAFMANLFLIGHDAGHGSFCGRRAYDQVVGRLAFLPLAHPFSVWSQQHVRIHHRFTNQRDKDFVWAPSTLDEYRRLPAIERLLYRTYRSTPGLGLYYLREIWWQRLFRPVGGDVPCDQPIHRLDRCLAGLGLALQVTASLGLVAIFHRLDLGIALSVLGTAVVLPFAFCTWFLGFGTYFNHTHPTVVWYAQASESSYLRAQVDASVHLVFPPALAFFLGNVMEHPAHHLAPRVPLARLRDAQREVSRRLGDAVVLQRWGWRENRRIMRTCKLYDYEAQHWVGYDGRASLLPVAG